jgi:hypothetical protein
VYRTLFRQNRHVSDIAELEKKLFEAETRLALGVHYRIPYPRAYYVPVSTVATSKKKQTIVPAYMDSLVYVQARRIADHHSRRCQSPADSPGVLLRRQPASAKSSDKPDVV